MKVSKLFEANYNIPEGIDLTVNRGGTSSGKTYSIMQLLFVNAWNNPNTITTVVGQDIPNLKKGAIRDAQTIIYTTELIRSMVKEYNKTDRIFTLHNDSIIEFNSYDDEQDAKNGKRDFSFFNEVNGIGYGVFEAIYVRTRIHSWLDFNPSSPFWLTEKNIESRDNVRTIKSTYIHNPFLDEKTIAKIKSYEPTPENIANNTADEYRWKVYGQGEYAPREGAILKKHCKGRFNDDLPVIWGMDFGVDDEFTISKFAFDNKGKRIYAKNYVYESGLDTEDIRQRAELYVPKNDLLIVDCADKTKRLDLLNWGFNAYPSYKGKVVDRLQDMMPFTIVIDDSPHLENELINYVWSDKKSNTPIDAYNHIIDPMGYCWNYYKRNMLTLQ